MHKYCVRLLLMYFDVSYLQITTASSSTCITGNRLWNTTWILKEVYHTRRLTLVDPNDRFCASVQQAYQQSIDHCVW